MTCLDEAERIARDDPARLRMVTLMRAEAYVRHEHWNEAVALLDGIEGQSFPSPNDALQADVLRGKPNLAAAIRQKQSP